MKRLVSYLSCLVFIVFVACDNAKSVGYYEKHPQDANNKIKECNLKALPVAFSVSSEKQMDKAMRKAYGSTFVKECKNAYEALETLKSANKQAAKKKKQQPSVKSVEYYKNNPNKTNEQVAICEDIWLEFEDGNKEIEKFINSEKGKIFKKECENAWKAYESLF